MFFSGKPQQRKVDLRGNSRGEETREQILERTRAERERRQQSKLESKSALLIQSHWRQLAAARKFDSEQRQQWAHAAGKDGWRQALQELFTGDPKLPSALLFCYDHQQEVDRRALASVCSACATSAAAGSNSLLAAAASAAVQASQISNGSAQLRTPAEPTHQQLELFRVQKLASLCLSTLADGGPEAAAVLCSPHASLSALQQQQPMAAMLDFLVKVVNPDTWHASILDSTQQQQQQQDQQQQQQQKQADSAAAGAEAVLRYLFEKGLTAKLRMLLLALPPSPSSRTCAEGCVTQMVVRVLKLHLLPVKDSTLPLGSSPASPAAPTSPNTAAVSPAAAAAASAMQLGATQLLCVPAVWSRAPSLVPVAPRLCGLVLGELQQLQGGQQLADALLQCAAGQGPSVKQQQKVSGSRSTQALKSAASAGVDAAAVAVAGLVESFIEAAAAGTVFKGLSQPEQVVTAGKLVSTLVLLLDAARQLSTLQQRQWRMKQHKQRHKQQAGGKSIYDTKSGASISNKTGYVPGAGFVGQKASPAAADMDIDPSRQTLDSPSMVAQAGFGETAQTAAAAAVTADVTADAAAMDVDQPAAAAAPSPGPDSTAGTGAAVGSSSATTAATAGAAGGSSSAAADAAKASKAAAAAAADAAVIEQPVAASAWSAEEHNSSSSKASQVTAIDACLQLLAGTSKGLQLLKLLVATLLPATTAAQARELYQQLQQQPQQQQPAAAASSTAAGTTAAAAAAAGGLSPGCAVQQQLLELIWALSRVPEHRQRVWLGLGVGARLVPRLWCSLVLPIHLSTPGGLLYFTGSTGSSSSSSGGSSTGSPRQQQQQQQQGGVAGSWMLPLLVLCQAFNAALSFTQVEDFYAPDGGSCVLPQSQLYDAAAPAAGLIMLVKAAVWQVLWFNSACPPGLPPPPPAVLQQQQQMKAAAAEVCGLLLCQLHDRNCQRQFCPPAAFLCELATEGPARLAQEVAAASDRMVAAGEDGVDAEGADDSAWQQQQQWQQQRQQGLGPLAAVAAVPAIDDGFGSRGSSGAGNVTNPGAAGEDPAAAAAAAGGGRISGSRVWVVLEHAPCLIPFELRVQLLQLVLQAEKAVAVESGEMMHMWDDPMESFESRFVTIRRDELMEDGFNQIGRMDPDRVKGRLRIQYVNEAGLPEAGIDGGGLFKDFMEELLRQGFSPQSHLMAENPQHQLYPNPAAFAKYTDAEHRMGFLGRMLGKCLYEGMLLELPLAGFFLKKMRGGVCDINDMPSLDPEVYKHLLQLRHYKGDYAELSLSFTATVVESASRSTGTRQREIDLKPGGRDIAVKPDNVIEYIHRLADFRLNRQMDRAAAAFLRGFFELIKPRWVRMFNEPELQMLISGSEEGVDVDDLMKHINYAGGYHEQHPVVITLWETLRGFTPQEQRQFLKFVTSCSRAPLLGFAYLEPCVCVQMSGGMLQPGATQRLPTAATCMNLLKLPPYRTVKEMREKLLYAISAGAGFELS